MQKIVIQQEPIDTRIRIMLDRSLSQNQFEGSEYGQLIQAIEWELREEGNGDPLTDEAIQRILDAVIEIVTIEITVREVYDATERE